MLNKSIVEETVNHVTMIEVYLHCIVRPLKLNHMNST